MHNKENNQISETIEREMAQIVHKKNSDSGQVSFVENFNIRLRSTAKKVPSVPRTNSFFFRWASNFSCKVIF